MYGKVVWKLNKAWKGLFVYLNSILDLTLASTGYSHAY